MNIAILGAGMVGRAIAEDLSASCSVTSFDINDDHLNLLQKRNPSIRVIKQDLKKFDQYKNWLNPFDLVVSAVPGFMGYETLKSVILCGKHVADISFFPENALQLDSLAKEKGVTVITDIGVAPGLSNLTLGYYNERMKIRNFECYVGGLPKNPKPPFYYKAPFSPIDVIEEYIRPARLQENGSVVTRPALSQVETIHFDQVGALEAFNTDGLRSLLYTLPHIPDMKEKTLRYPGHIQLIISLQQAGFFEKSKIQLQGTEVSPLEFTSRLLIREWKLEEEEEELTVMRLIIEGEKRIEYNLLDYFDKETQTSSMARTTGYTCTAAVHLIWKGLFTEQGVYPPELVGKNKDCFEFVLNYLKERNVYWTLKD